MQKNVHKIKNTFNKISACDLLLLYKMKIYKNFQKAKIPTDKKSVGKNVSYSVLLSESEYLKPSG